MTRLVILAAVSAIGALPFHCFATKFVCSEKLCFAIDCEMSYGVLGVQTSKIVYTNLVQAKFQ
jgi:hypothetical protein